MGVWILHPDVSNFGNFKGVWILFSKILPKVSEFRDVKSKHFQTLEGKIQVLKRQGENLNTPNFRK